MALILHCHWSVRDHLSAGLNFWANSVPIPIVVPGAAEDCHSPHCGKTAAEATSNTLNSWQEIHVPSAFPFLKREKRKYSWTRVVTDLKWQLKKKKKSMPAACGIWGHGWLWMEPTPNPENLLQKASGLPPQGEFWGPGAGLHNPSGHCFGETALTPVLPLCVSLSFPSLWLLEKVRAFPVSGFVIQESTPSKCLTHCF